MKRKMLVIAAVMVMLIAALCATAFAAEVVDSGKCGENVTWTLDSDGLLTISGEGKMTNSPWKANYSNDIIRVIISDGVTTISGFAFESHKSLTNVTISDSVTAIGSRAFGGCTSMTTISLGNSVNEIGWYAFIDCASLESILIPSSVTTIGEKAFDNCPSLTGIWVDENNQYYSSDNHGVLFNKDKTILIKALDGITEYSIPDPVVEIENFAFSGCKSMASVTIPDNVTTIGEQAFYYCKSLTSVTLPANLNKIGRHAFSFCSSLTGFLVNENNQYFSTDSFGVLYDKDKSTLIRACETIAEYDMPDSVTSIGIDAFYECELLSSITISESVTDIGQYAFYHCKSLTNIDLPDSLITIGVYAFDSCDSLTSITIPKKVTNIGAGAFRFAKSLNAIVFKGDYPQDFYNEPSPSQSVFFNTTATAYYPANNPTWTEDVRKDYGGHITWVPYEPESADIIADTVTAFCGEGQTADVNISYVGDGEISSVRMVIDSALPIADITSDYEFEYNEDDGWIIIWAENGASFGESVLLTLHYDLGVDPAYDDGKYTIGINLIEVTDKDEKLIELTAQNGAVIIENPIKLGDVNMDGVVDNRDIILIARFLVSLTNFNEDQLLLADFNCDGKVNNTDLVLISRSVVE